jgi:hypothetical protein
MAFGNPNNDSFPVKCPDTITANIPSAMIPEILFNLSFVAIDNSIYPCYLIKYPNKINFHPHELHSNFFLD